MSYLKLILLLLFSFLLIIAVSSLASISFPHKLLFGNFIYLTITLAALNWVTFIKPAYLLGIITLPVLVFNISFNIFDYQDTFLSFPANLSLLLGISTAYLVFKAKHRYFKLILVSFDILICLAFFFFGYEFIFNKVNYGNYKNIVSEQSPDFTVIDEKKVLFTKSSISPSGKLVLIDFWTSSCAPCYKIFPAIDSINKIKGNAVDIYTINVPLRNERPSDNFGKLSKLGYTFKSLYALNDKIVTDLKIMAYPTTLVMKGSEIIYRGDFLKAYEFSKKYK
jgi:thiol-disulfide isomerase/thioredoxin